MSICRTTATLLFLALVACGPRSPEEAMLQAFSDQSGDQIFDREAQPKYLAFTDPRTASAFSKLMRSGRYRIPPAHSSLLCPSVSGKGIHGYWLGAKVDTAMGDSAYAELHMDCIRYPQRCPYGEQTCATKSSGAVRLNREYLLVRKEGEWQLAKAVGAGVSIPVYVPE